MIDKKPLWFGRKPTAQHEDRFFTTANAAARRPAVIPPDPAEVASDAEFRTVETAINLALPPVKIDHVATEHQMITDATGLFIQGHLGEAFQRFEDYITPYFHQINTRESRRRGDKERVGLFSVMGSTPIDWHVNPDNGRKTYYYKIRYMGKNGSCYPFSYEQGLSERVAPTSSASNLAKLSIGLDKQGKIDSMGIVPPKLPEGNAEKAPFGITRIQETPRIQSIFETFNSIGSHHTSMLYISFRDRTRPVIRMGSGYELSLSGDGFVVTKPKEGTHKLAQKLGDTLTGNVFIELVEEIMRLVLLHNTTDVRSARLARETRAILDPNA